MKRWFTRLRIWWLGPEEWLRRQPPVFTRAQLETLVDADDDEVLGPGAVYLHQLVEQHRKDPRRAGAMRRARARIRRKT